MNLRQSSLAMLWRQSCVMLWTRVHRRFLKKMEPSFPENFFSEDDKEILNSYANLLMSKQTANDTPVLRDFPETHLRVKNTWIDPGKTIFNRWLHGVSQIVPSNRKTLFRQGVNLSNLMDYIS